MKTCDDVVSSWHLALSDERPSELLAATRLLIRDGLPNARLYPTPDMLLTRINARSSAGDLAWTRGPSGAQNDAEREVWRAWGGAERYATLPDPKYSDEPLKAHQVLSFSRREFLELFSSTERSNSMAQLSGIGSQRVKEIINETVKLVAVK